MKQFKIALIATIITAIIICSCAYALPAKAEEFEAKLVNVIATIHIESNLWVIICEDEEENVITFFDDEGIYQQNDTVGILIWTPENEVIDAFLMERDEIFNTDGHT